MQENKNYVIFILGYDLLQNHFSNSIESECDLVYEKCSKIADDFLVSKYNSDNKSLYDCIVDYVRSERYINFINSLEEKHIKTLDEWHESTAKTFTDFCKPGEIVDQNIVDYFSNSLSPICSGENFVQAGGAFDHILDKDDNLIKPLYTTFEKENGHWLYKGNCFKGKNEDMTYVSFNSMNSINKENNELGYIEECIIDKISEMNTNFNWNLQSNKNMITKIMEKIKEDDELSLVLDETIASAVEEIKKELNIEEKKTNERE